MNLVRWEPFRELEEISNRLNRMFDRPLLGHTPDEAGKQSMVGFDWSPSVDVCETPAEYQIRAELPDIAKEDVKVVIDAGMVRIQGERKQEKEDTTKKWHRVERSYGSFLRTFSLPVDVDDSKVVAEFKDGLLTLHLPKTPETKSRAIEVKVR